MSAKAILVFCAQAVLFKFTFSQCIAAPGLTPYGLAAPGLSAAFAYDGLNGFAGRGLPYNDLAPFVYDGPALVSNGLAYDGIYPGIAPAMDFTPTTGGVFPVTSASAIPPLGISITSDNVYEGALTVVGELPFVGTTVMEGIVPSEGSGAVNHACGNGNNAMVSDTTAYGPGYAGAAIAPAAAIANFGNIAPAAVAPLGAFAPINTPALGYGDWAGRGCGYAML